MSKENRKKMYDQLVTAGRFDHIDQALIDEFGDPNPKVKITRRKTKKWE